MLFNFMINSTKIEKRKENYRNSFLVSSPSNEINCNKIKTSTS